MTKESAQQELAALEPRVEAAWQEREQQKRVLEKYNARWLELYLRQEKLRIFCGTDLVNNNPATLVSSKGHN